MLVNNKTVYKLTDQMHADNTVPMNHWLKRKLEVKFHFQIVFFYEKIGGKIDWDSTWIKFKI